MSGSLGCNRRECKVCGSAAPLFAVVDIGKTCGDENAYPFGLFGEAVYYARCSNCGFVFTDHFDDWSALEWSTSIYNAEYKLVDPDFLSVRPEANAAWLADTVGPNLCDIKILDFGSGNGKTEEFLRLRGFANVVSYDPIFNDVVPDGKFDLVTAFEVVEHSPNPVEVFRQLVSFMSPGATLVFQTCLTPDNMETIRSGWWYMSPRNGHVSLYSSGALQTLAHANSLAMSTNGVTTCMYHAELSALDAIEKLRLTERFAGWSAVGSHYAALSQGAWHHCEETSEDGKQFRWTAAASGASIVICRPAGLSGAFSVTITAVMTAPGVDQVLVLPIYDQATEVVSSSVEETLHRFTFHGLGSRCVRFMVTTSRVVVPTNGDLRALGVAILRPILTMDE